MMRKYRYRVCGHKYDPREGDPRTRTELEELPEDCVCPICGAAKDQCGQVEQK